MIVPPAEYQYPGESDNHFRRRRRWRLVNCGEAYHLFRLRWQIFGHVTFAHVEISYHKRASMLFAAIASTYARHRLKFRNATWVWSQEVGKLGRITPHVHFLLAALPKHIDLAKFCHRLVREWRRGGGGLHKITPYDRALDGAGYLAKCAGGFNGFSRENCVLTFSPAALARLKQYGGKRHHLARGAKLCAR